MEAEGVRTRLLQHKPSAPSCHSATSPHAHRRPELLVVRTRSNRTQLWVRVDGAGDVQKLEIDEQAMMSRYHLPARDLRLLDPLFAYPPAIIGREKAIVVNLDLVRCIITTDEIFLLNFGDWSANRYLSHLQKGLMGTPEEAITCSPSHDHLPFEFKALEMVLHAACNFLQTEAEKLVKEAHPPIEELRSQFSTGSLDRVRQLKSRLATLTHKVQMVRDELHHLMDDDVDMTEMYLSEKKKLLESSSSLGDPSTSALISPPSPPKKSERASEKSVISVSRRKHDIVGISDSKTRNIEDLEMLFEAYFLAIDGTLNNLTSLKQYIEDTAGLLNIQLGNVRNQLMKFEVVLATATVVMGIFGVVAGIFGMNFPLPFFQDPSGFQWVVVGTGISCVVIFGLLLLFLKIRTLMPPV